MKILINSTLYHNYCINFYSIGLKLLISFINSIICLFLFERNIFLYLNQQIITSFVSNDEILQLLCNSFSFNKKGITRCVLL